MAEQNETLQPIHAVREKGKLWIREPESQDDSVVIGARLCSCRDVCLALVEDR